MISLEGPLFNRRYLALSLTVSMLFLSCGYVLGEERSPVPDVVDFNAHVRPIFNKNCTACHGGVKQAGDVSFVYKEQLLPPDGWIVEPGDPGNSILIDRVLETDPGTRMPPPDHGPALSKYDVAILSKWIQQGAIWDASHWSYAAPKPQTVPPVSDPEWGRVELDRFVLAKLDKRELKPSRDAEPDRWLRRVTLDLIGLPPKLSERADFLREYESDEDSARHNVVSRLLDSPAFGERWGSVWLDQVRYADSKGLGLDGRRSVWKYRDWVIDAFNRDMPFDEFTIKQIAGDLLPDPTMEDLIATAANRLTQSNEEGGTDDEEFRVAAVLDRVNTVWQTWQGITFGCVQCHSHPYDPFRHEEYYKFAAFFNNTADCDLNEDWPVTEVPIEPSDYNAAATLDHEIDSIRTEVWQTEFHQLRNEPSWKPVSSLTASTNNATRVEVERVDGHDEFFTVDTVTRNTDFTLEAPLPDDMKRLTAIRFTGMPLDPKTAVSDSEWGFVLSQFKAELVSVDATGKKSATDLSFSRVICDEPEPFYDPNESLNEKSKHGFAAYSRIHYPRQAAFLLKSPVDISANARLRVTLKHRVFILAAFSLVTRRGHLAVSDDPSFSALQSDSLLQSQRQRLAELRKKRASIKSVSIPTMQELPEHLKRPTHVFDRGLFLTKGELVTPGTPHSLPPLQGDRVSGEELVDEESKPNESKPNRLTLAQWLASPRNPLTARVAVNRVWAHLFGTGLVASEEDFGSSGDLPSHPELLDFLALRFQNEQGWSMKKMIREIALSRTYGQTSKATEHQYQIDQANRWLSRGPRYRLPSEMVRDQALAISGLLSDKRFGPPVHPPIPNGVWRPFSSGDKWNVGKRGQADRYRRSIYTYMKRSIPYPMFAAFDAPSREFCAPRRLRSNTPIQALMMLNDETFIECAAALALRMNEVGDTPREQVRHGFLIATCREPNEDELDDLIGLFEPGPNPRSVNETTLAEEQLARLETVATILLNLDEVVMK